MGYVGFLEDIVERFMNETQSLKNDINDDALSFEDKKALLNSLIGRYDKLMNALLEISTNPKDELVNEVFNLKAKISKIEKSFEEERVQVDNEINDIYEQHETEKKNLLSQIADLKKEVSYLRKNSKNI